MAIPTFVAAGTAAGDIIAITPGLPAGIAADDILLLFLETANQAVTIPTPNGGTWTEVTDSPQGTGAAGGASATRLTVFWSRYNGTQGAPTTDDPGDHVYGVILAFRGCITSGNPWDVTSGDVQATADTTVEIPGDTTTVVDCLVVVATVDNQDSVSSTRYSAWTNADLATVTEQSDGGTAAGNGGGIGVATGEKAAVGAYTTTTATAFASTTQGRMSVALKPPAAAGATHPGWMSSRGWF